MAKKSRYDIIVSASTKGALKAVNALKLSLKGLGLASIVIPVKVARKGFDLGLKALRSAITKFSQFAKRTLQIGAGLIGVGGFVSAKAFADLEQLKLRLRSVSATAEESEKNFKDIFDFSTRTPFDPSELVSAFATLQSFGAGSVKALEAIGSASFASGKQISDVVAGLGGLSREVFIPLGIDVRNELQASGKAFVKFRDKAGKQLQFTANSAEELRLKLIEAFSVKFGGTLDKASETVSGLVSTVKGNLSVAFAKVGEGFSEQIKSGLTKVNDFLVALAKSGVALKIGRLAGIALEKAGKALKSALPSLVIGGVKFARAIFVAGGVLADVTKGFINAIKGKEGTSIGDAILTSLTAGSRLLTSSLVLMAKSIATTLVAVGEVIGSVIKQAVLDLPLPGFAKALQSDAKKQIDKQTQGSIVSGDLGLLLKKSLGDANFLPQAINVFGGKKFRKDVENINDAFKNIKNLPAPEQLGAFKKVFKDAVDLGIVGKDELKKLAKVTRDADIRSALSDAGSDLTKGLNRYVDEAKNTWSTFSSDFEGATGVDVLGNAKKRFKQATDFFGGAISELIGEIKSPAKEAMAGVDAEQKRGGYEPTSRALRRALELDEPTSRALRRSKGLDEPTSKAIRRAKGLDSALKDDEPTSRALRRAKGLGTRQEELEKKKKREDEKVRSAEKEKKKKKIEEENKPVTDKLDEILEALKTTMGIA